MLEFRQLSPDEPPGSDLIQAMRDEIAQMYPGCELDGPSMPRAGPAELRPPGGTFVVGLQDGVAVCCGGVKRLPDGACEIKRIFVAEQARGRGLSRAVLEELERRARDLGYTVVRLDTGPLQGRSQGLFERSGYRPIPDFNGNPIASYWGEKRL